MKFRKVQKAIRAQANRRKAVFLQRFFKTGKGEYAEGDKFLGLTVPQSRKLAKRFVDLGFPDLKKLLASPYHEERLIALLILVEQFNKSNNFQRGRIYRFYLSSLDFVNNWDLVDLSADKILGAYLLDKPKTVLIKLAHSQDVWCKRVAIVSTYQFIRRGDFQTTLQIAKILIRDKHDLIHKAVGWMLREVGKRSKLVLEKFLKKHATVMPRTMLRYAIEKFSQSARKVYLRR